MAAGLWICRVLPTHPLAYVPAVGPAAGDRWQRGAIIEAREGDSGAPPNVGTINPPIYQWHHYAGRTVADLVAKLPVGVPALLENIKGNLKLTGGGNPSGNFDNDVEEWE